MLIRHKCIVHERTEDAPFVGALIVGINCDIGCPECFNQEIKEAENLDIEVLDLIKVVTKNPFNKGLILGGLEWTCQPREMLAIVDMCVATGLDLMVYTGHTEEEFFRRVPQSRFRQCYIKFGSYDLASKSGHYYSHGVKLASTNQYIKWFE